MKVLKFVVLIHGFLMCILDLSFIELDTYVVYLHFTCLFIMQERENNKEELHKK